MSFRPGYGSGVSYVDDPVPLPLSGDVGRMVVSTDRSFVSPGRVVVRRVEVPLFESPSPSFPRTDRVRLPEVRTKTPVLLLTFLRFIYKKSDGTLGCKLKGLRILRRMTRTVTQYH